MRFSASQLRWMIVGGVGGLVIGIAAYTFIYAQGGSYLTNNPAACANCHIMQEHFDAWTKSSHRSVAVCNDCHTPHSTIGKYWTKAQNGFWHSVAFTSGDFPDPLRIKPSNRQVTEEACRSCHQEIVDAIDTRHHEGTEAGAEPTSCVRCHATVGHWVR
ncbi:MAG: cytochrome c nitrite reductase small subunit [Chlorobi bacterium]|nr:cytochrome c nitrite reductase small subunit [Chlorobiota bacterium]MBX7216237.1 cytochrome c nitrite reductase small subunit [Candidatus Kapabacteria bacterium]MCE7935250.1 cytochrome c nitrite reductase small subunit [Chlorobi bacterium CHB2]